MYPSLAGPFAAVGRLQDVPAVALKHAMEIMGTDKGNVQLASWGLKAELRIADHSGFKQEFLNAFRVVHLRDSCACGRALLSRKPVMVADVLDDSAFGLSRSAVADAGVRAVLSVPMISNSGALLGIVSTHQETAGRPSVGQLRTMNELARSAANAIIAFRAAARRAPSAMLQG